MVSLSATGAPPPLLTIRLPWSDRSGVLRGVVVERLLGPPLWWGNGRVLRLG